MKSRKEGIVRLVALVSVLVTAPLLAAAQASGARRTPDGKPDFSGIWQAVNTAAWDLQDHSGEIGWPPGQGVVEGNQIPYQPWAAAKKLENFARRKTADPVEANCYLPGVPRATYMRMPCASFPSMAARIRMASLTPGWAIRGDAGTATRWWST